MLTFNCLNINKIVVRFFIHNSLRLGCGSKQLVLSAILVLPVFFIFGQQHRQSFTGGASYYSKTFENKKTANGEQFSNYDMTCASKTLKFHTFLKVTNLKNQLSTIVRVNDRGPYAKNRVIDLTEQAARVIGTYKRGVTKVSIEIIKPPSNHEIINRQLLQYDISDLNGVQKTANYYSVGIWRTRDLQHAILLAQHLNESEYIQSFYIGRKLNNGRPLYYILILNIESLEEAQKIKDFWERKGFMRVVLMKKFESTVH